MDSTKSGSVSNVDLLDGIMTGPMPMMAPVGVMGAQPGMMPSMFMVGQPGMMGMMPVAGGGGMVGPGTGGVLPAGMVQGQTGMMPVGAGMNVGFPAGMPQDGLQRMPLCGTGAAMPTAPGMPAPVSMMALEMLLYIV